MKRFRRNSNCDLRKIWESFGWLLFANFDNYVAEVRNVEADIKDGKISVKKLKGKNEKQAEELRFLFSGNEDWM